MAPRGVRAHHRVEDGEELSHACGQRDFLGLAGREEATIERAEHRVAARADEGRHEQRRAPGRATTPDESLGLQRPAVAGQGGDSNQGRDLFARQRAELWQFADERANEYYAEARR